MKVRITVIEDSRESQIRVFDTLSQIEHIELEIQPIIAAPFFDAAIEEAIRAFDPHLIVLDLLLTRDEESGFRVLRKLKVSQALNQVPVVVCSRLISGDVNDKRLKNALACGAVAAFSKVPFPSAADFLNYASRANDELCQKDKPI